MASNKDGIKHFNDNKDGTNKQQSPIDSSETSVSLHNRSHRLDSSAKRLRIEDTTSDGENQEKPEEIGLQKEIGVSEEIGLQKEIGVSEESEKASVPEESEVEVASISSSSSSSEYLGSDDTSNIIVHTDDEITIHDDELGEALTALNLLLFEVKLDPLSFEDFKNEKKIKRSSKQHCRNREAMGITEVSDHSSIIGCPKLEPDRWMSAKLFADLLFNRASHLGVKMEKVGCTELIKEHNCNTTYLIQAIGERKNRAPQTNDLKIEYFCCNKKELDTKFDPAYKITVVLTLAELTGDSPHFFTNNLRNNKGYLRATPVEWLNLSPTTGV
jgi:hypothetical protein